MKASRAVLLAVVAQLYGAALLTPPALAGTASAVWSDLWHTPDQQGQALLDAGEPAQAAARFRDPRRRAYADLAAERDPQAAKLLAPFTDAESEYNRGNALAKSGQLQAALTAYDAALKQDPTNQDARHNRDLVERALRRERQMPQSSSGNGRQRGRGAASKGQEQKSGGGQRASSGSGQSGAQGSQSGGRGQAASNGSQASAGHSGDSGREPSSPQASGARKSGSSKDSAAQAQRDASLAAALAQEERQRGIGDKSQEGGPRQDSGPRAASQTPSMAPHSADRVAGGEQTPPQKPESEQQLALEQWLRQIPDSPAGLLRRKFLIEHMMRQQYGEDPEASGR